MQPTPPRLTAIKAALFAACLAPLCAVLLGALPGCRNLHLLREGQIRRSSGSD